MSDPVLVEIENNIATLTLNRPDDLNAFSDPIMIEGFVDAVNRVKEAPDVRAVILTGAGRAFSAGGNVKHMRDKAGMFAGSAEDIEQAYLTGILRVPPLFYNLDIPTIAAVNGPAYGAALDLVCMCDIRLAAPEAKFCTPFVNIGIAPGDGAAWFLPRIVGQSNAAEMLLTATPINAARALEIGLIGRIVPQFDLLSEAKKMASTIASNAPLALQETKRLMRNAQSMTLEPHLAACAKAQGRLHITDDHNEAINALFEKRIAQYQNK